VFVLPFLAAYEVGVRWLGPTDEHRNGADAWLREALAAAGQPDLRRRPFFSWCC